MSKRRRYSAAYEFKVTRAAARGDKALSELAVYNYERLHQSLGYEASVKAHQGVVSCYVNNQVSLIFPLLWSKAWGAFHSLRRSV